MQRYSDKTEGRSELDGKSVALEISTPIDVFVKRGPDLDGIARETAGARDKNPTPYRALLKSSK